MYLDTGQQQAENNLTSNYFITLFFMYLDTGQQQAANNLISNYFITLQYSFNVLGYKPAAAANNLISNYFKLYLSCTWIKAIRSK